MELIGNYAFYNCTNLETVTIPATVYEIGRYAFSNCSELVIITPDGCVAESYAIENNIPVQNQ